MQLTNLFNNPASTDISKILVKYFGISVPLNNLSIDEITRLHESVSNKINKIKMSQSFHESEKNPRYLGFILLENLLDKAINETQDVFAEDAILRTESYYPAEIKWLKSKGFQRDYANTRFTGRLVTWKSINPRLIQELKPLLKAQGYVATDKRPFVFRDQKHINMKGTNGEEIQLGWSPRHAYIAFSVPRSNIVTPKLTEGYKRAQILDALDNLINKLEDKAVKFQSIDDTIGASLAIKDLGDVEDVKDLIGKKSYAEAHAVMLSFTPQLQTKLHAVLGDNFFKLIKKHSPRYFKNAIMEGILDDYVNGKKAKASGGRWNPFQALGNTLVNHTQKSLVYNAAKKHGLPPNVVSLVQAVNSTKLPIAQKQAAVHAILKANGFNPQAANQAPIKKSPTLPPQQTPQQTAKTASILRPSVRTDSKFYKNANQVKTTTSSTQPQSTSQQNVNNISNDAISALVNMGYSSAVAKQAVGTALTNNPDSGKNLDTLIRTSLQKR